MRKLKKAFITGITGQDGSWLADFLLEKGYEVHGMVRRTSSFNTGRIDHIYQDPHVHGVRLFLHYGDLSDSSGLFKLLHQTRPDEIYNLGAQSHVRVSFDQPEYTGEVTGVGTLKLLEAMRSACPRARFYQASSSELYGGLDCPKKGYNEKSPFYPRSPYGVAKIYSFWAAKNYREAYGSAHFQRHPLQPRERTARRDLRDPQDHPGRGPHQGGPAKGPVPGKLGG